MTNFAYRLFSFIVFLVSPLVSQTDSVSLSENLAMGIPSAAVSTTTVPRNYLMVKPQFVLSYDRITGIPNWVAWHIDSTWLGEIKRSNNFRADSTLPEQWYRVHQESYRRSGYDRGHMCPSGDRTNTQNNNLATFVMTNMIPQAPNNNQGPWAALEIYCRELVLQGKELYIYCGGNGLQGFLDSGRVQIPERTWKTILVIDAGTNDLLRVTSSTRTIAVIMPNRNELIKKNNDWRSFRVSVDSVESLTGYDFFSHLSTTIQSSFESSVDAQ